MILGAREQAIIHYLDDFKLLTRSHLQPLVFSGLSREPLSRSLIRLEAVKLVSKHRLRRPGKLGGAEIIYQRSRTKTIGNIDHTLALADVFCTFHALGIVVDYQAEPRALLGGVDLRPDLSLTVSKGARDVQVFVEVDLASERVPQLTRKLGAFCEAYERVEGLDVFPLVIVVTTDNRRAEVIKRVIAGLSVPKLFAVATFDTLARQLCG